MSESSGLRTVLITGAAGAIGTAFRQDAAAQYRFRLADKRVAPLREATRSPHDVLELDIVDLEACRRACRGIDTVLHLAADPRPNADFYGSLLDANIKGVYNIFRAAKDEGCRRVVFASSAQAIESYSLDRQVTTTMPVLPKNIYGATKCFGEAIAGYFAHQEGLSAIVVRIGNYAAFEPGQSHTARDMSAYLSRRDMVHLLTRCIDIEDVHFAIVHGISDNRFKRLYLSDTRTLLDYRPCDDAFDILGLPLHDG